MKIAFLLTKETNYNIFENDYAESMRVEAHETECCCQTLIYFSAVLAELTYDQICAQKISHMKTVIISNVNYRIYSFLLKLITIDIQSIP